MTFTLSGLPGSQLRDVQVWDAATLAAAGAATDLNGALYLGSRSADGSSLMLHSAAGDEQVLAATGRMNLLQAAAVDATTDLTYTSQVPWITSVTVNTTTLPSQLTLTIDPTLRGKGLRAGGPGPDRPLLRCQQPNCSAFVPHQHGVQQLGRMDASLGQVVTAQH